MSTSQGKPPSPSRRRWTAEEDSLLGTKSDRALARKFGRTVKAVKNRRRLKGVFLVKEWRPEDDKILGTRLDRQAALLLGRLIENVAWRRRKLGIPCCYENRPWKPEELELLGRKPDEEVATLTGHPLFAVKVKRRELGRPKADPVLSCWTPGQDRLLGTCMTLVRPPAVRLVGGLLRCVLYQAFLVFFQGRPDPQACCGSERTLARMPVKGEEPGAAHRYGCCHENKVVATWAKGRGKTAGQALGLLKCLGPVNRFQAEAYALVQVG